MCCEQQQKHILAHICPKPNIQAWLIIRPHPAGHQNFIFHNEGGQGHVAKPRLESDSDSGVTHIKSQLTVS